MSGIRIGYLRVSTKDQHLANQRSLITADKFFEDTYTGKIMDRPGFKNMMEFIREGDTLVCYSTDRLSRNFVDLKKTISELLERGIKIEFIKEGWKFQDKLSPTEQLLLSLIGVVAEFEIAQLDERRAIGIKRARDEGKLTGRKPKFTPGIYKEIEQMTTAGIKKTTIAKYLGISLATVYNYKAMNGEYKSYTKSRLIQK